MDPLLQTLLMLGSPELPVALAGAALIALGLAHSIATRDRTP